VRRSQTIGTVGPNGPPARALAWLPLLAAALWLLHPLQLTGVLYVVQRMTSMTAAFVLLGLLGFVHGRTRLESGHGSGFVWMLASLALAGGLGFLSKQNAVLLPFFAFLIELFFFDRAGLEPRLRRWLRAFYAVTVLAPALIAVAGLVIAWDFVLGTYGHRHFTPAERLMTEARILWFYLSLLAWPDVHRFALHHDDIVLSTGLLEPWTTLVGVVGWIAVVAAALLHGVRRRSAWAFGVLWFLVGHSLESSFIGLELTFEHRNYLPSVGPVLAALYYALALAARVRISPPGARGLAVAVLGVVAFATLARASVWADRHVLFESSVRNHPDSSRAHGQYALLMAVQVGDPELIFHHWQRAAALNPREVLGLVEMSKMLQGYILHARRSAPPSGPAGASPSGPLDPLASPIGPDLGYLEALDAATNAEIVRRLDRGPVETSTIMGLVSLRSCVQNDLEPCVALLPRAIDWFQRAAASERIMPNDRAIALVQLAKLYALTGRVEEAVTTVEKAIEVNPGDLHLYFEIALLHIERGDAGAAREAIARIDEMIRRTGARADEVEILRARLSEIEGATGARAL
jgi:hypothetical protein